MRVAVYADFLYRRQGADVFAEDAFALFLAQLAERLDGLVLIGRLDPHPGRGHYLLPADVGFVPLPHYESLADPVRAGAALLRSLRRAWGALARVDVIWLFGPHPLALAFAALATLRRRPVVLGVRQDLPSYVRTRRPGRRGVQLAALLLEAAYRALGRVVPVVVVGEDLAQRYSRSSRLLRVSVSLVEERDIVDPAAVASRRYGTDLQVLSVGRLDPEKNPLLLADVTDRLRGSQRQWRLVVCGRGALEDALRARAARLGLGDRLELRGYVPVDAGLRDLYRTSHVLLHVSWTEGLPQVLFEAFAAGVPVVATDVGGVTAVREAALLVPPGDPEAAAAALERVVSDQALRARLVESGFELVRSHSPDRECGRIAAFLVRAATA